MGLNQRLLSSKCTATTRPGSLMLQIQQGGSFDKVLYTAMGSGSLAALSALEVKHYWQRAIASGRSMIEPVGTGNRLGRDGSVIKVEFIRPAHSCRHGQLRANAPVLTPMGWIAAHEGRKR